MWPNFKAPEPSSALTPWHAAINGKKCNKQKRWKGCFSSICQRLHQPRLPVCDQTPYPPWGGKKIRKQQRHQTVGKMQIEWTATAFIHTEVIRCQWHICTMCLRFWMHANVLHWKARRGQLNHFPIHYRDVPPPGLLSDVWTTTLE